MNAASAQAAKNTLLAMEPPPVLTMEYKERQWLAYWASAYGEHSEPFNGHEKKLWWRQTFGEEYTVPVTWNDVRKATRASS